MDWKPWLTRWSDEWVRSSDPEQLDPDVQRDRWLGFAPAAEETVAAAEARLGLRLPPSYREFLLTTDGWRNAGCFVWRLRDTSDIGWLRDIEPYWEEWEELTDEEPSADNRFTRGLMISLEADAGVLFLDPGDVDDTGEWAAYSLFSWRAEPPIRFPSFHALMESLYAEFHQMRQPEGGTRDSLDAQVEQARSDALAGDFEGAAEVLAKADEFGRPRAAVLLAQLHLFTGRTYQAEQLLGRIMHPSFLPEGFLSGPLFTEELLPLLFVQHTENSKHHRYSILQSAMIGDRPDVQLLVGEYQARVRTPGRHFTYGDHAFDTGVRAALETHEADSDALWLAIEAAFTHWRPRSADHIVPVALLADPRLAASFTPERGRRLLSIPRGDR